MNEFWIAKKCMNKCSHSLQHEKKLLLKSGTSLSLYRMWKERLPSIPVGRKRTIFLPCWHVDLMLTCQRAIGLKTLWCVLLLLVQMCTHLSVSGWRPWKALGEVHINVASALLRASFQCHRCQLQFRGRSLQLLPRQRRSGLGPGESETKHVPGWRPHVRPR